MQPHSHQAILRRAAALARAEARLDALLAGDRDEDRYRWPFGLTSPSIGFTHTYRPGRARGELGLPSARTRCAALIRRAKAAGDWRLAGRACHLLVDVAVPARSRGVWHYFGDPLERWIEANLERVAALPPAPLPTAREPEAIVESLAAQSVVHPADTTKSLSGLTLALLGRATRVSEVDAAAQARLLVPQAIAHAAALLSLV